jgi:hypothetical protein
MIVTKDFRKITQASSLNIGDMMVINEDTEHLIKYNGYVILRVYKGLVCLDNPNLTWDSGANIKGTPLNPRDSVTLTQE